MQDSTKTLGQKNEVEEGSTNSVNSLKNIESVSQHTLGNNCEKANDVTEGNTLPSFSELFWTYLCLGMVSFGGAAMVPFIGDVAVNRKKWLSNETFKEGVAIVQVVPGATSMQAAAYVGLRTRGMLGAAATYVGFGLPAFCLMLVLSIIYSATHGSPVSKSIFAGLQVMVVAIVAKAVYSFSASTLKSVWDVFVAAAAAVYLILFRGNPVGAIFGGALLGILVYGRVVKTNNNSVATEAISIQSITRALIKIILIAILVLIALFFIDRELFTVALLMLKVDLLAFGGGFGSVPIMLHSVVDVNKWMDTQVFMDGIAMGQVTPGPIVITATFVGYQLAGIAGSIIASIAIFLPSYIILALVVPHFDRLKHNKYFSMAMRGVLAAFVGLLLSVAVKFGLAATWSPISIGIGTVAFAALMFEASVIWVVVPGAILSALLLR